MADIKLKPCPFCGGKAEIAWEIADIGYYSFPEEAYHAKCTKCGCDLGGVFGFETEEEAAEAWNRRAEPKSEKAMKNKGLGTKIEDPNEVEIYDIITVIREYNRTTTAEHYICDENDTTTLADIEIKDAHLVTVIAEKPLHGEIYRYNNHGAFWEQIGTTCGYA